MITNDSDAVKVDPAATLKPLTDSNADENVPSWRRPLSRQTKTDSNKTNSFSKLFHLLSASLVINLFVGDKTNVPDLTNENDVVLRRTNSFQNDPE